MFYREDAQVACAGTEAVVYALVKLNKLKKKAEGTQSIVQCQDLSFVMFYVYLPAFLPLCVECK